MDEMGDVRVPFAGGGVKNPSSGDKLLRETDGVDDDVPRVGGGSSSSGLLMRSPSRARSQLDVSWYKRRP